MSNNRTNTTIQNPKCSYSTSTASTTDCASHDYYHKQSHLDVSSHLVAPGSQPLPYDGSSSSSSASNYIQPPQSAAQRNRTKMIKLDTSCEHQQQTLIDSKHLVRTVSDLPVFVTIEGYPVASYSINGEPYLCLAQFLQQLKQDFSLDKLIANFEETITNFTNATPKQIEGFIKASVLPANAIAKSCPLIRRSDADRICLNLYDISSRHKQRNDIIDLCLKQSLSDQDSETKIKNDKPTNVAEDVDSLVCEQKDLKQQRQQSIDSSTPTTSSMPITEQPIILPSNSNQTGAQKKPPESMDHPTQQSPEMHQQLLKHKSSDKEWLTMASQANPSGVNSSSPPESATTDSIVVSEISQISDEDKVSNTHSSPNRLRSRTMDLMEPIDAGTRVFSDLNMKPSYVRTNNSHVDSINQKQPETNVSITGEQQDRLFDVEVQNPILNLAKAATSTLMIQVYHRCFGKCSGLFYPSLLRQLRLDCIQCSICYVMLEPRRFIGHTHGSKESNVCHWGFNSYNWRHYIRLSKRQTMNNLDDDELMVQFRSLLSAPDSFDEGRSSNGVGEVDKYQTQGSGKINGQHGADNKFQLSAKISDDVHQKQLETKLLTRPMFDPYAAATAATKRVQSPYAAPKPLPISEIKPEAYPAMFIPTKTSRQTIQRHHHHRIRRPTSTTSTQTPANQSKNLHVNLDTNCLRVDGTNFSCNSSTSIYSAMSSPYRASYRKDSIEQPTLGNMTPLDLLSSVSTNQFHLTVEGSNFPRYFKDIGVAPSLQHQHPPSSLDFETRRDIYIGNNMALYLGGLGFNPNLTKDIIDNTIDIVRKSRMIY